MRFSLIAICVLLTGTSAGPTIKKRHVVHERRQRRALDWDQQAELDGSFVLPMRIALTQSNLDRAEEFLMNVSHPESPNYGKHWSAKQVAEMFAPSDKAVASVFEWLAQAGISGDRVIQSQSLNWIHADVSVTEAETLLKTKYFKYTHAVTGQAHVACEDYSLPEDIQKHVDFITPTVHFDAKVKDPKKRRGVKERKVGTAPQVSTGGHNVQPGTARLIGSPSDKSLPKYGGHVSSAASKKMSQLSNCNTAIIPTCLQALYGLPTNVPTNRKNSFAVVEYTPQAYLPGDLDLFFNNFSPSQVGQRPTLDSIDGGFLQTANKSFNFNAESDLDLEYAMALVNPQKVTLYQVGDNLEGGSFNNFLDAIDGSYCTSNGGDDPYQDAAYPDPYGSGPGVYSGPENCGGFAATNVISTSYTYNEADLTPAYEIRQCNEYMKLGLQGVTFLYSSGDNGVAGNGGSCIDPTTGQYNDGTSGKFNPSFPGTCPYVTSVGATQVSSASSVSLSEVAAQYVIYSGGGFSNVFAAPSYQTAALKTYFAKNLPSYNANQYNNSQHSRGFPDVSANGVNYVIGVNGALSYVFGTSASSPTFASVIAVINAARLNNGQKPVGFINPTLYLYPYILNDITSGSNPGCGTSGFTAGSGWDPVTGLGTPNYPRMVSLWLKLP